VPSLAHGVAAVVVVVGMTAVTMTGGAHRMESLIAVAVLIAVMMSEGMDQMEKVVVVLMAVMVAEGAHGAVGVLPRHSIFTGQGTASQGQSTPDIRRESAALVVKRQTRAVLLLMRCGL